MRLQHRFDSKQLVYIFSGILLVGSIVSGYFDPDKRWMNWHFSRLGEGGTLSSIVFNLTLVVAAVVVYFMSRELSDGIYKLKNISEEKRERAIGMVGNGFQAIACCLVVVSLFPFDRFPVVHNIFGYSMLFIFLYICTRIVNVLPIFSKKFMLFSHAIIIVTAVCYVFYLGFRNVSLLSVEFVIFIMLFIWLLLFIEDISKAVSKKEVKSSYKK